MDKYGLPAFLVLTVLFSALFALSPIPRDTVPMLMVLAPVLLGVLFTALEGGRPAVMTLFRRLSPRLGVRWYIVVIGLAMLVRLSMTAGALAAGWVPGLRLRSGSVTDFVGLAALLFVAALTEEIGWRGYALPKLLRRRSALFSALFLGGFWGVLHLLLLLPGMMYAGEHPLGLFLEMVGLSVVVTWLFVQTGGNIFITTLYHAAQSFFVIVNAGMALSQQLWTMAATYVLLSVILVLLFGPNLRRAGGQQASVQAEVRSP
jgi:membrane protease YdiL (CAAX protease family)